MKKEMKFNRLFVSLMIAGCTLGFVACSDDDDPQTPTEPKVEDVYGDYTGTMYTALLDQSTFAEGEGEEPAGVDVAAQVKNDTVYFDEFPYATWLFLSWARSLPMPFLKPLAR